MNVADSICVLDIDGKRISVPYNEESTINEIYMHKIGEWFRECGYLAEKALVNKRKHYCLCALSEPPLVSEITKDDVEEYIRLKMGNIIV